MMACSKLQTAAAAMFLMALVVWLPAVAQDRVTDTELLAAYCLGVTTAQFETQSAELASLRAQARAKTISEADRLFLFGEVLANEEINKIIQGRRDRFRDYLTAKGFLRGRDIDAIKIALLRGPSDAKLCIAENKDTFTSMCNAGLPFLADLHFLMPLRRRAQHPLRDLPCWFVQIGFLDHERRVVR